MVPKVWTMLEDIKLETCSSIASFSGGNSSSSSTVLLCLITFIHSTVESFSGHVCLLCPIEWQMLHLRRYSSGTMVLGPSLTIGGLEHLLLLCPGCPHLLHDCVIVLSEEEACRPSIGRPDCLFVFGFKTTRAAMSDGTTHEEGWPIGIIGTEYASISVSLL